MQKIVRLPLPALMLVLAVFYAVLVFLVSFLTTPAAPLAVRAISTMAGALVFGVLFGLVIGRMRKRAGPAVEDGTFGRARRSGVVPADADPVAWRQALDHQLEVYRRQRWYGPVVFGLALVLNVWLALTDAPYWWAGVALFAGILLASVVTTPRMLRRTSDMLAELDRREAQPVDR
ncbi:hypothetical protein [Curtobacterium sp. MCBD17_021]|uniref:hypothetical protein n=1 Tax=Curtobacterium sp. MCBD17_021 TaxID=2175665 RepID=UPI000DA94BD4|nr:hypothetical protein [Curtobacterium sp. MCBD17_021]PZE65992.1 hypothetical protein DEI83_08270 [Curtobacterium sp. MCBD17_021]